jgi:protein TonB
MKNSKKVFNSAGQSTTEVKKSQKHDANLQKNSTLYFQIGLILCLLGTYALFEMQFQEQKIIPDSVTIDEVAIIDVAPDYRVHVEKKSEPKPKVNRSVVLKDKFEEVPDDTDKLEADIFTPDAPEITTDAVTPDFGPIEKPKDPVFVPFDLVEKVPVYPGCERKETDEEKRKCMSKKITKLIHKKFNTDIAEEYGLSGLQKISTQFTVDKYGNVTDVKIRGPHPALEKEANRVINKIPSMTPGYQSNTPVGVIYTLPIKFQARN